MDTTLIKKTGQSIEFISRMFDHVSKSYITCFPTLFLGYFDGKSFFPIDFSISATKDRLNNREKEVDKRSCGCRRRKEAKSKATDTLLSMLKRTYNRGVDASYVLFDSWFSHDILIKGIVDIGYHVICRCKLGRVKYRYQNKEYTAKQLFSKIVRKRMKWNAELGFYAASIMVSLPHTGLLKLVFEKMADEVALSTIITRLWKYFKYLLIMSTQILFSNNEKQTVNKLIDYMDNTIGSSINTLLFEGAKIEPTPANIGNWLYKLGPEVCHSHENGNPFSLGYRQFSAACAANGKLAEVNNPV